MEVYVFRSVVVSLKDILRENNLLLEDVQSVFVDRYGEDDYMDYFVVDEENEAFIPTDNGNWTLNPKHKSTWKKKDLLEKIRGYEED